MNNEVINLLLEDGIITSAENDNSFDVVFLTTPFLDDATGIEIELIYDESGKHVTIVGRVLCSSGGVDDQSALVRSLWAVNRVNEGIVEAEGVGAWMLSTESGNFLYTASCPKYISLEALFEFEFCKASIQTFVNTRKHFTNFEW